MVAKCDRSTYLVKETALELSCHAVTVRVDELALAVHLTVSELSFVLVALRPFEDAFAVHQVSRKLALIGTAICIDCIALAMLLIASP